MIDHAQGWQDLGSLIDPERLLLFALGSSPGGVRLLLLKT
jgi:hypothetical protein